MPEIVEPQPCLSVCSASLHEPKPRVGVTLPSPLAALFEEVFELAQELKRPFAEHRQPEESDEPYRYSAKSAEMLGGE